jgi:hypothetical protein
MVEDESGDMSDRFRTNCWFASVLGARAASSRILVSENIGEKQVDQDAVSLLPRFHPVATDMKEVVSAMKIMPEKFLDRFRISRVNLALFLRLRTMP